MVQYKQLSECLEKMSDVLEGKRTLMEEDEDLQFVEKFSKLKETIKKQGKLLNQCTNYYVHLKQFDFGEDTEMGTIEDENEEEERKRRETQCENSGEAMVEMEEDEEPEFPEFEVPKVERRPLTNEEKVYLEKWGEFSKQMDETLDEIASELEIMITKLKVIDEESQKNMDMTNNISSHMYTLNADIRSNNEKLKDIVKQLRSPKKICADITLGLVVCLLVGVLVYIIRLYINLE